MAVSEIFDVGRQGMGANRQAIQVTANNIANANTPGYSRQRPVFVSHEQSLLNGTRICRGVEMRDALRIHDSFVERQIVDESRGFGESKARATTMNRVQDALAGNSVQVTDLMNGFFNDLRELSVNPEQPALRTAAVLSAKNTASGFRELSQNLQNVRAGVDAEIENDVLGVNTIAKEVAGLNAMIGAASARRGMDAPHELEDRRQMLLQQLSEKIGATSCDDQFGRKMVILEGVGVLVHGDEANHLMTLRSEEKGEKAAGSVDVAFQDGNGLHIVTNAIKEGTIGGNVYARDKVLNRALTHLDATAHTFITAVNDSHRMGIGKDGGSGRDLFQGLEEAKGAADRVYLNQDIEQNSDLLSLGYTTDTQSDNRAVLDILSIQQAKLMASPISEGGEYQTMNESLSTLVGDIGVRTKGDDETFRHKEGILNQLNNYRDSISGVNLEEEAINMMQYQTVYNASLKALKVGGELLGEILKIVD